MRNKAADLPPFHERAPWWGGDLQTLRNRLVRPAAMPSRASERLYFPLTDGSGDRLAAMLDRPRGPSSGPLIVLIHGLAGCEDSAYMRLSAAYHLRRQRRVLRLNLRGAGPSRRTCGGQYHSGCAPDIRDVLMALDNAELSEGVFLVGYSLGGNVLINLLVLCADDLPVRGAVTVSAAIDPAAATRRLMAPRNALYHRWLLNRMKRETASPCARLDESERRAILDARTILEFDDGFTAPRNGFKDAAEYYARTAANRVLSAVPVPILMVQARNDPWIPPDAYLDIEKAHLQNVTLALHAGGGHVGFHDRGYKETWYDRHTSSFLDNV